MVGIKTLLPILLLAVCATAQQQFSDADVLQFFSNIDEASAAAKVQTLSAKSTAVAATTDDNDTATFANRFKYSGSAQARLLSKQSTIALAASKLMMQNDAAADKDSAATRLLGYKAPSRYCPNVDPVCEPKYPYRYPDGSCNNLGYSWWGKAETPLNRVLPAAYDDGINEPRRVGVRGYALPNPRVVAHNIHYPLDKFADQDVEWSNLFPHFCQFMDHDVTLTGTTSASYDSSEPLECSCKSKHPDCLSFKIPYGDYLNEDSKCMATPRSASSYSSFDCKLGKREQLNLITAWWDLSQVYGSSAELSDKLRAFKNGLLKVSTQKGDDYMIIDEEQKNYIAGDVRATENVLLETLQTMWLREHNRIARILKKVNPSWEDERLFQEARVITVAEYQHIIHNEVIPQIIGWDWADQADLLPYEKYAYANNYDASAYPNILNEFSTAAYRFGHTLVSHFVTKRTEENKVVEVYDWNNWLQPALGHLYEDGYNQLARGCIWDPMGLPDGHINNGMYDHIGEKSGAPGYAGDFFRLSLPALNILRGRDHGIRPYNDYRKECGLPYAYKFSDLLGEIPEKDLKNLEATYDHVDDIDLWTGGLLERVVKGGSVGPTFACILSRQFRSLKNGDRFHYENGQDEQTRLTLSQLKEIKSTSFARVMCDNANIEYTTPDPFRLPLPEWNPLVRCDEIQGIDFNHWREVDYKKKKY